MPGQFRHLIAALAAQGRHRIVCIGQRVDETQPGIGRVRYAPPPDGTAPPHPYLVTTDRAVRNGEAVAGLIARLAREGGPPDAIIGHPGWGETLYVKEVLPTVPLMLYGEFFYRTRGADVDFDPSTPQSMPEALRTRTMNAPLLLALDAADHILTPTEWQKSLHPAWTHPRLSVIFDGIDATAIRPDATARLVLPGGAVLTRDHEVVSFAARGLEPYRGFPSFMRALPSLLRRRPAAHVIIAGADAAAYGRNPREGGTWRAALTAEIAQAGADLSRVHFVGTLPRDDFTRLLQIASVHAYLTVPFVLSWSMLEAMAAGCVVVGSATPPVEEVITDGENGFLVDFFDHEALAARIADALAQGAALAPLRAAARATILARYDLQVCVPRQVALVEALASSSSARA
jgi:glycosyltransferase involved in cell wall biosynthesis